MPGPEEALGPAGPPQPPLSPPAPAHSATQFRSDLLFLVTRFLQHDPELGPLGAQLRALISRQGLLTPRYDWRGQAHARSFEEVERDHPGVAPDLLLELAQQFCSQSAATPGQSLLGRLQGQLGLCGQPQRGWHDHLCQQLKHLRRTLGHLSRVYCLLFDRTGQCVFTGADDLLVKCWRVTDGGLIHTFRGASSEITDMAVSHDNRLLAAGSVDKIIRVWCLSSASPVAVLTKHTGMITGINFCPYTEDGQYYLASTSGDGTVSFWKYAYNDHDTATFDPTPTRYHEKIRPGQAGMICASFSPGGLFFCVGSADHHVRVYQMNGLEGPVRILEEEAHADVVESIQWCNQPDLRFLSGSKDGTARIWRFTRQQWTSLVLDMGEGEPVGGLRPSRGDRPPRKNNRHRAGATRGRENRSARAPAPTGGQTEPAEDTVTTMAAERRVTMVAWTQDDVTVVTAVSNKTLKLWDSRSGRLKATLSGHEGEIFVLEPHPLMSHIMLSAAHDGQIIVWDLERERALFKHKNRVDDHNCQAEVFDAKWSPDALTIAATDSYGHLLFIGHGSSEKYDRLPVELFFHTDYRPLLRDISHHVVDEQTQVPPHLLPPPFLVDSEGNPYESHIQKFVPGRERMSEREAHLPGGPEPSFNVRNEGGVVAVLPPAVVAEVGAAPLVGVEPGPSAPLQPAAVAGPLLELRHEDSNASTLSSGAVATLPLGRVILKKGPTLHKDICEHLAKTQTCSLIEAALFTAEANKSVLEGGDHRSGGPWGSGPSKSHSKKAPKGTPSAARRANPGAATVEDEDTGVDTEADQDPVEGEDKEETSDCSMDESDFSSAESTTEEETDHSDWGSDQEKPPPTLEERSRSKRASDSRTPTPRKKTGLKSKKKRSAAQRCRENMLKHPSDISDAYMPSQWLSESTPKRSPYFPQMSDVLMYFKQGHRKYIDLVKSRKTYTVNMREEQEWMKRRTIGDVCLVKVVSIKFEIRPPRLCVLKLALLNQHTMRPNGEFFTIKYHDMNDVVDFLILHEIFKNSKGKHWKNGDRIRCQIDDCWWKGTVQKVEYHDANKRSPFLSIYCHWDNGEKEYLSPWDIEALDGDTALVADGTAVTPEQLKSCLYQPKVDEWNDMGIEGESKRISDALEAVMSLAISEPFNYPVDLTAYPEYMLDVEYPMDLNLIKSRIDSRFYRRIDAIEYDVSFVASNAASFNRPRSDIVRNAKIITKLILELIRDPTKSQDDVSSIYHRLVETFSWSDHEDEAAPPLKASSDEDDEEEAQEGDDDDDDEFDEDATDPGEGTSHRSLRSPKKNPTRSPPASLNPKKWKHECNVLLTDMAAHPLSVPFREPVSELEFPDYFKHVTTPMDISTVRESLLIGEFDSPVEFKGDVNLIYRNSKLYNTDPKSKILSMTVKLEDWFEQRISPIIAEWKRTNRRLAMMKSSKGGGSHRESSSKGKGKGKGKGQSNNIRRSHNKPKTTAQPLSDEDGLPEDEESSEDEEDSPKVNKSKKTARKRRAPLSSEDERPAKTIKPRPMRSALASPGLSEDGSADAHRRTSTRVPKAPARYKEDVEFDEDNAAHPPENGTKGRLGELVTPQLTRQNGVLGGSSSGERPKRQRKPLRNENFAYSDAEEDEDDAPLIRRPNAKRPRLSAGEDFEDERSPQESTTPKRNPRQASPKSATRVSSDEDDDLPLARKLGARMRQAEVLTDSERRARIVQRLAKPPSEDEEEVRPQKLSLRNARRARASAGTSSTANGRTPRAARGKVESYLEADEDEDDEDNLPLQSQRSTRPPPASRRPQPRRARQRYHNSELDEEEDEVDEETTEEDESEDEKPLRSRRGHPEEPSAPATANGRRTQREAARNSMRRVASIEEGEDDDDNNSDDQPLRRRSGASGDTPGLGRTQRRTKRRSDYIDDETSEDEEDESEGESLEPSGSEFEEAKANGRSRPSKGSRGPPQQPKLNASRRAAQAIDSESEHTSARRPSRPVAARNGTTTTSSGRKTKGPSYLEDSEGDSGQENRRPRRAAAAKKMASLHDSEASDEDDFEEASSRRVRRIV
eukprot:maker-scaffold367_size194084-snap-gene-0.46 protein:Tk00510 transcript:maker-scaffold367_size194084-snap-gene-0.46-mRNA-1 annotation:"bromodomain and wd repeat-containing protein 3 isoform x1"